MCDYSVWCPFDRHSPELRVRCFQTVFGPNHGMTLRQQRWKTIAGTQIWYGLSGFSMVIVVHSLILRGGKISIDSDDNSIAISAIIKKNISRLKLHSPMKASQFQNQNTYLDHTGALIRWFKYRSTISVYQYIYEAWLPGIFRDTLTVLSLWLNIHVNISPNSARITKKNLLLKKRKNRSLV